MNKGLIRDLSKIQSGHPVNWKTVEQRLLRAGVEKHILEQAFHSTPFSSDEYKVIITCQAAFDEIKTQLNRTNANSRSNASLAGNSHTSSVNGAMLAVWCAGEKECINRIFMDGQPLPTPSRPHALVIENEECFLNKEDTYQFVSKYCRINHPIHQIEFIYGSGNSISNKRIIPYLKTFTGDILCLLDVDLGGLRIYANLLAGGLSPNSTKFLVPHDFTERLARSKRQASENELAALSKVYGYSKQTDQIIIAIRHYQTTIEQESYRAK